jgi:hypothetical protein
VSVAYDYNDTFTEFATISTTDVGTWGSGAVWGEGTWGGEYSIYQHRIDFKTQKCTALKLRVTDSQTAPYNEGYSVSALSFEYGAIPGGNRLRATKTVGTQ